MELKVTILDCQDLVGSGLSSTPNAFVLGKVGCEEFRTTTKPGEQSPSWNVTNDVKVWNVNDAVVFDVRNEGRFLSPEASLGTAKVSIKDLLAAPDRKLEHHALKLEGTEKSILHVSLQISAPIPPQKIAIIGAGVAGATSAYFTQKALTDLGVNVSMTIFEKDAEVGGRIGSFKQEGYLTEKGGTGLVDTGHAYFRKFVDQFGLKIQKPFDFDAPFGIWDGKDFCFLQSKTFIFFIIELLARYGIFQLGKLQKANKEVIDKFNTIYPQLEKEHKLFHTGGEFYAAMGEGGLLPLTQQTMDAWCQQNGVEDPLRSELVAAFCRANNGLPPPRIMSFVGILSLMLDPSALYSVEGGNVQVIEKLIAASGATLKLQTPVQSVNKITRPNGVTAYSVTSKDKDGNASTEEFDYVLLAASVEAGSHIAFNFEVPYKFPGTTFSDIWEVWVIGELNEAYFNREHGMPGAILTFNNPEIPFENIVSLPRLPDGRKHFKVFSSREFSDDLIAKVFKKRDSVYKHRWQFAFPDAAPSKPESWPKFELAPNFYFVNVLESSFSNVESTCICGKNVANLVARAAAVAAARPAAAAEPARP